MITEVRDSIITRFFALLMIPSLLMVTTASCKKEIQPELSTQQSVVQYTAAQSMATESTTPLYFDI
jgi:hypothetical protein